MFTDKGPLKYNCDNCDYHTNKLSQWERHINTPKHKKLTGAYPESSESKFYFCDCGRKYTHRQSLCRHRKTCQGAEILTNADKMLQNASSCFKCECGKEYTHRQSLHKHKRDCKFKSTSLCKPVTDSTLKQLLDTLQDVIPKLSDTNKTTNINSNNNIINVQMFLNDKCADAMSIQNFANQLLITMDDLTKSKKDCISNVVLKNLKPMSLTERPFHCTNLKKKEWFVKDETEGWEEDTGEKLIKNTEYGIQRKWCNEFEKRYPDWMKDDAAKDRYIQIAGSTTAALDEKTKLKLLRELANEATLNIGELVE